MADSPATTIEYLRARLLAERSVSKAARQRADELAKKVIELEKQLKLVSLQRKKAEKATADILAILENHGRSDVSEGFDSSSDQGEISSDYKGGKLLESSENAKVWESEANGFSSSEVESSSVNGRSLSWKSTKDSPSRSLEKKYVDASKRKRGSFTSTGSSPKRVGKSCRQIRRREHRLAVDGPDKDAFTNALLENEEGTSSEGVQNVAIRTLRKGSREDEDEHPLEVTSSSLILESHKEGNGKSLNDHKADRDMERALEHQAQLIGQYEAEEKAQREWEDKFRENNGSALDSCDPGTHSDVTEERDEVKAQVPPFSIDVLAPQGLEIGVVVDANSSGEPITSSGFQPSPVDTEPIKDQKNEGIMNDGGSENRHYPPDSQYTTTNSSQSHVSSQIGSILYKGEESSGKPNDLPLKPHENANQLGSVLEALQLAKLSLKQNLTLPLLENQPPVPTYGSRDKFPFPFSTAGLFRLPTDYQYGGATTLANLLGSDSGFSLTSYPKDPTGGPLLFSRYRESPSRLVTSLDDRFQVVPTFPYLDVSPGLPTQRPSAFDQRLHAEPFAFDPRLHAVPSAFHPRLDVGPTASDPRLDLGSTASDPRLAMGPSASNLRLAVGPSASDSRLAMGLSASDRLAASPSSSDPRLAMGLSASDRLAASPFSSDPRLAMGLSASDQLAASPSSSGPRLAMGLSASDRLAASPSSSDPRLAMGLSASDRLAASPSSSDQRFAMGPPLASDRYMRSFAPPSMPSSSSGTCTHMSPDGRFPSSLPGRDAEIPSRTRSPLYDDHTRAHIYR